MIVNFVFYWQICKLFLEIFPFKLTFQLNSNLLTFFQTNYRSDTVYSVFSTYIFVFFFFFKYRKDYHFTVFNMFKKFTTHSLFSYVFMISHIVKTNEIFEKYDAFVFFIFLLFDSSAHLLIHPIFINNSHYLCISCISLLCWKTLSGLTSNLN